MDMHSLNIDIGNQRFLFEEEELNFKKKYGLLIKQVLIYNNILFIIGLPEITDSRSSDYVPYEKNNVFAFSEKGTLLWQRGKRSEVLKAFDKTIVHPCMYIEIDQNMLKLYYQSDHEVWLDPKTGEKIKEEFVFKK